MDSVILQTVLNDQVDFVKVSEGMGAKAYRVADIESFEKALKEAIELNIPCVIECDICKDDKGIPYGCTWSTYIRSI